MGSFAADVWINIGDQYDTPNLQWQQSSDEGMTWQNIPGATGNTYAHTNLSAGYYYYRYLLANDPGNLQNSKCRIISNVKVVHVVPKFYTIVDTLCEELSFSFGDKLYDRTGIYVDSLLTVIGCRFESAVSLQRPPFLIDLGPDLSLDLGDAIEVIPFLSEPADNYHWEPSEWIDCTPDCATLNWAPVNSTQISLSATSSNGGCVTSDSMYVEVKDARKVLFRMYSHLIWTASI